MAKKKKVTEEQQEEKQEAKVTENSSPEKISYSGTVKVTISSGKKVIAKKLFHNAGKENLFKFLALCLQGSYSTAETLRPMKIKLFYNKATSVQAAEDNINNWSAATKVILDASNFKMYDTTATIEKAVDDTDKNKYITTFHFKMPFVYIKSNPGIINQMCIYGQNITNNWEYSACYLMTKEQGTQLDEINIASFGQNYNIIIEWEMALTNQITK